MESEFLQGKSKEFLDKWSTLNIKRFNDYILRTSAELGLFYDKLEVVDSSEYSCLLPHHVREVESIYQREITTEPAVVIDSTANIGCDTLEFARLYPQAKIQAIEINPATAQILQGNINRLDKSNQVYVYNQSAIDFFQTRRYADVIFFDPPWDQMKDNKLYLGDLEISVLISYVLKNGMTPLVILKLPPTADIDFLINEIHPQNPSSFQLYDVHKPNSPEISYLLLFIRSLHTTVYPVPLELPVPKTVTTEDLFSGILVAILLNYPTFLSDNDKSLYQNLKGTNDLTTNLNIWNAYINTNIKDDKELAQWAYKSHLDLDKFRSFLGLLKQATTDFKPVNVNEVMNKARPLLHSLFNRSIFLKKDGLNYFSTLNPKDTYFLETDYHASNLLDNPPIGIIALQIINTNSGAYRVIYALDTDKDYRNNPIVIKSRPPVQEFRPRSFNDSRDRDRDRGFNSRPITIPAFPYKSNFIKPLDLIKRFKNLASYQPQIINSALNIKTLLPANYLQYEDKYLNVLLPVNEYEDYNLVSDYFNEAPRMACRKSYKSLSPLAWWERNYPAVYQAVAQKGLTDKNLNYLYELRETEYAMYKFECESFKPSNAIVFIDLFKATSVLDISAGWGDRLAACLARQVVYVAADPNPDLHPGYQKMIKFYQENIGNPSPIKIEPVGFEELDLDTIYKSLPYPDLVITSPPYFDLEIYQGTNQSINKYPGLNNWLTGFLIPALEKAYRYLVPGGHMVINIEDDFNNKYVKLMIDTFNQAHPGSFLGTVVISKDTRSDGRPFFVWRKI